MARKEIFDPSAGLFTKPIIQDEQSEKELLQILQEKEPIEAKKNKSLGRPTAPDILNSEEIIKISVYIEKDQLQNLRMFRATHPIEFKDQSQIIRTALKEFFKNQNFC